MKLFLVHVPLLGWTWRYATGRPLHAHFEAVLAPELVPAAQPVATSK
jgi:hypothetical protein